MYQFKVLKMTWINQLYFEENLLTYLMSVRDKSSLETEVSASITKSAQADFVMLAPILIGGGTKTELISLTRWRSLSLEKLTLIIFGMSWIYVLH